MWKIWIEKLLIRGILIKNNINIIINKCSYEWVLFREMNKNEYEWKVSEMNEVWNLDDYKWIWMNYKTLLNMNEKTTCK